MLPYWITILTMHYRTATTLRLPAGAGHPVLPRQRVAAGVAAAGGRAVPRPPLRLRQDLVVPAHGAARLHGAVPGQRRGRAEGPHHLGLRRLTLRHTGELQLWANEHCNHVFPWCSSVCPQCMMCPAVSSQR